MRAPGRTWQAHTSFGKSIAVQNNRQEQNKLNSGPSLPRNETKQNTPLARKRLIDSVGPDSPDRSRTLPSRSHQPQHVPRRGHDFSIPPECPPPTTVLLFSFSSPSPPCVTREATAASPSFFSSSPLPFPHTRKPHLPACLPQEQAHLPDDLS